MSAFIDFLHIYYYSCIYTTIAKQTDDKKQKESQHLNRRPKINNDHQHEDEDEDQDEDLQNEEIQQQPPSPPPPPPKTIHSNIKAPSQNNNNSAQQTNNDAQDLDVNMDNSNDIDIQSPSNKKSPQQTNNDQQHIQHDNNNNDFNMHSRQQINNPSTPQTNNDEQDIQHDNNNNDVDMHSRQQINNPSTPQPLQHDNNSNDSLLSGPHSLVKMLKPSNNTHQQSHILHPKKLQFDNGDDMKQQQQDLLIQDLERQKKMRHFKSHSFHRPQDKTEPVPLAAHTLTDDEYTKIFKEAIPELNETNQSATVYLQMLLIYFKFSVLDKCNHWYSLTGDTTMIKSTAQSIYQS